VPEQFVRRRVSESSALKALLQPAASGGRIVGLTGMGGAGKSTLAQWLAALPEVRSRYPDGVFWLDMTDVSPGSDKSWQEEILAALGYEQPVPTPAIGRSRLREVLQDSCCLIVLDNVSDAAQLDAFDAVGANSAILLTTRERDALRDGVERIAVEPFNLLDPDELADSRELLASYAHAAAEALPGDADEILKRCGGLPLALAISGAMVHDGDHSWAMVARLLRTSALDKLTMRFRGYAYPSLLTAIEASVGSLDPDIQERFCELAVFAGQGPVPLAAVARLWSPWGIDEPQAHDLVVRLARRSLLRYYRDTATLVLHDLLFGYADARVGDGLPGAHARLADSYLRAWGGLSGGLPNLGDGADSRGGEHDEYGVTHMAFHLAAAGRDDLLHHLLAAESPTSSAHAENRWFAIHDRAGRTAQYLADVDLAWQRAQRATDSSTTPEDRAANIALEMRYALAKSSLTTMAASVPTPLMIALVRRKMWSFTKAWAYVDTMSSPRDRAGGLGALARLPDTARIDRGQFLTQARAAAEAVEPAEDRAWALAALVPCVPAPDRLSLFEAVMEATDTARREETRAWILARLAPHLPEQVGREFLAAVRTGIHEIERGDALAVAARHLPKLRTDLLAECRCLQDPSARMTALIGVLACTPEPERPGLLTEALAALNGLARPPEPLGEWTAAAVAQLAPYLPCNDFHPHHEATLGFKGCPDAQAQALAAFLPYLPEADRPATLDSAVAALRAAGPEVDRETLAAVVPHIPEANRAPLIEEIVSTLRTADRPGIAWMLCALAPYLPEQLLTEAVDMACAQTTEFSRARALDQLTPYMPPELLKRALDALLNLDTPVDRGHAFVRLAPRLPAALLDHALTVVATIEDPGTRAGLLADLAPHLPPTSIRAAVDAVPSQADTPWRAVALMQLAARAPEPDRDAIHTRALDAADLAGPPHDQLRALTRLASDPWQLSCVLQLCYALDNHREEQDISALERIVSSLPDGALDQATEIVRAMSDPCARSCGLATLVRCTPGSLRATLLKEAVDAACLPHNHDDETYCQILQRLAEAVCHVPETERLPLLTPPEEAATSDTDRDKTIRQLTCTASYLPMSDRQEVLDAALRAVRAMGPARHRVRALTTLAPWLPPTHRLEAVELADVLEKPRDRVRTLTALAVHSPPQSRPSILARAVDAARSDRNLYSLVPSLVDLSPLLMAQDSTELFGRALDLIHDDVSGESHAGDIADLAPHLPTDLFDRASHIAEDISTPIERVRVSRALALARDRAQPDYWCHYWRNTLANAAVAGRATLLWVAVDACLAVGNETPSGTPEPTATYLAESILDIERWWPGGSRLPQNDGWQLGESIERFLWGGESGRAEWMSA